MNGHNYLNDPRLDDLKNEPLGIREVYAWRLAEQDRIQNMTDEQLDSYYDEVQKEIDAECEELGINFKYADTAVLA
jgi:hypothetical protein